MKRFIISFGWVVAACVAVAGTGTSNEFRLDCRSWRARSPYCKLTEFAVGDGEITGGVLLQYARWRQHGRIL